MFTIKLQSVDRKGNFTTVKTLNTTSFSKAVAEKAMSIAKEKDLRVSFYVRGEEVPEGWASRQLEFSTQIWLNIELDEDAALAELEDIPF